MSRLDQRPPGPCQVLTLCCLGLPSHTGKEGPVKCIKMHPSVKCPYKAEAGDLRHRRDTEETQRHRDSHVTTEAETRGRQPQAKDAWIHQKLDEAGRPLPWSLGRELSPSETLVSDSQPLEP